MILNLLDRMKLPFRKNKEFLKALYDILGFYPHNIEIYRIAFSHKSLSYRRDNNGKDRKGGKDKRPKSENTTKPLNNERLEYLGDAVLETVVSDILFRHFPNKREGFLTSTRSKIVQREALNRLAEQMGLENLILAAQGTRMSHTNIGGNAFEALMGAIYLDRGYKFCHWFITHRVIGPYVDLDSVAQKEVNFKSKLLEWCQKNRINTNFRDFSNNEGEKGFRSTIVLEGITVGKGNGRSKKESQQLAAKDALTRMRREQKLYDSIFRAKEKRTAMEADESFALPKLDEIEKVIKNGHTGEKPVLEGEGAEETVNPTEAAYDAAYNEAAAFEVISGSEDTESEYSEYATDIQPDAAPNEDIDLTAAPRTYTPAERPEPQTRAQRKRERNRTAKTIDDAVKGGKGNKGNKSEEAPASKSAQSEKPTTTAPAEKQQLDERREAHAATAKPSDNRPAETPAERPEVPAKAPEAQTEATAERPRPATPATEGEKEHILTPSERSAARQARRERRKAREEEMKQREWAEKQQAAEVAAASSAPEEAPTSEATASRLATEEEALITLQATILPDMEEAPAVLNEPVINSVITSDEESEEMEASEMVADKWTEGAEEETRIAINAILGDTNSDEQETAQPEESAEALAETLEAEEEAQPEMTEEAPSSQEETPAEETFAEEAPTEEVPSEEVPAETEPEAEETEEAPASQTETAEETVAPAEPEEPCGDEPETENSEPSEEPAPELPTDEQELEPEEHTEEATPSQKSEVEPKEEDSEADNDSLFIAEVEEEAEEEENSDEDFADNGLEADNEAEDEDDFEADEDFDAEDEPAKLASTESPTRPILRHLSLDDFVFGATDGASHEEPVEADDENESDDMEETAKKRKRNNRRRGGRRSRKSKANGEESYGPAGSPTGTASKDTSAEQPSNKQHKPSKPAHKQPKQAQQPKQEQQPKQGQQPKQSQQPRGKGNNQSSPESKSEKEDAEKAARRRAAQRRRRRHAGDKKSGGNAPTE